MNAGPWKDQAEFKAWWREHGRAYRRLSVDDPREWERIACIIEAFQREHSR